MHRGSRPRPPSLRLGCALLAVAALAPVYAGATVRPAQAASSGTIGAGTQLRYVALGDSVASGHGLGTTLTDPNGRPSCQRSAGDSPGHDAYTDDVRDWLQRHSPLGFLPGPQSYRKLACSGATVERVASDQVPSANAWLGTAPSIVTITAGVNDFEFTNPARYVQAFDPLTYDQFVAFRSAAATTVADRLAVALHSLGDNRARRLIAVTTYYNPFNAQSVIYHQLLVRVVCSLPIGDRPPCSQVIQDTLDVLNESIANAVRRYEASATAGDARATLVGDVDAAFNPGDRRETHAAPKPFCGDAPPSFDDSYIQAERTGQLDLNNPPQTGNDCFHPNPTGHLAIARLVEAPLARAR
jgi:lysophospholipase L1-like esterase